MDWILQTHNFHIKVFVRKSFATRFSIRQVAKEYAGVPILPDEEDHVFNFASNDSIRKKEDGTPWRGSREKDTSFIQCFIDSLTDERGIVFDWSPSTGSLALPFVNPYYFLKKFLGYATFLYTPGYAHENN